ncbi:penicillin-binding protein 2 [Edaphobacter bradus]|uniref:penicillin-binding protein 2 n=1 Tax=Edaphobacter bradus TaxID=2259016 RepID=UPI0021DF55AA|nr:penicillin-binding protein 2 [Edaphobacter bradus]
MELAPQYEEQVGANGKAEKLPANKLNAAQYLVALVLVVLSAGLWRLQVLGADNFRALAEANRVRKVPVLAPRGRLFDREGRLLVDNYPSVSCFLLREQVKDLNADLPLISQGLHIPEEQILAALRHYQSAPKYQPIPLKQDITPDEQAFIAAHTSELPELETLDEQRRLYPRDGFAAHLIGYVGEISEDDLNKPKYAFYQPGDVVGKSGVEETYDALLRGVDGSRDVIVNSHGKEIGHLGQTLAQPGQDLKLTIDLDVQMAAEKAMEGKTGAMVALDPHTGEILALVSRPTFDPNQFSVRVSKSYWNEIINNPDHPLLDKAIQAQLAPGSTFKIIMSYAGLQENAAQDMHVMCSGGASFYGHFFACDKRHGMVDIEHAIPWSCDTFYYTLANKLGIDTISKYATDLGLSQRTGVDLPDEVTGTMPSTAWKMKNFHEKWYAGEVISVGIGQGAVAVTPIQLARAIGGIASGGALRRPHLVFPDEVPAEELQAVHETFPGSGDKTVQLSTANWQLITDAMAQTTISGTAAPAHLEGIDFAGKTGTAQVVSHSAGMTSLGTGKERANAWFVGMAPRRNPDIVVAVLWEHGGWGAGSAPVAAQVINAFVEKQRKRANNLRIAETPTVTQTATAEPTPAPQKDTTN